MSMKLEEFARESRATHKGDKSGVPIVGLEHLIPQEIKFSGYDVDTENTFTKTFKKGQILFGRRRAYLKKAAIADFDGICSGDITVIEAIPGKVDPLLLPFIIQNDKFFDYAVSRSAGGLSPRVKWEHLKDYEFDLPPIEEQRILADKLWAAYRLKESYKKLLTATQEMVKSQFIEMFGDTHMRSDHSRQWKEVVEIINGKDYKSIQVEDGGYPVYGTGGEMARASDYLSPANSILLGRKGTIDKPLLIREKYWNVDTAFGAVPDEKVLHYVYFYWHCKTIDFNVLNKGTTLPSTTKVDLLNLWIKIPSMEEQTRFGSIVEQADKSEFVGCKSQFIEIFYGMETTPVKDYIDDSFPGEWGTEDKDGNGVKVIRTTNFTNSGKLNLADVVTRSIEDRKVVRKQIKKYDTILERSGGTADNPVGRVVLFEEDNLFLCNNFTQVLRFKDVDPRFAFYALYYFYQTNRTAIRSMGSKTTGIQNLNMSKYLEIGIPNASDEDQKAFVTIAEQADKSEFVGCKSQFIEMYYNTHNKQTLESVCPIMNKGITPKYVESSSVLVINQACIHWDGQRLGNIKYHNEEIPVRKRILESGDVLLNATGNGTLGRCCVFICPSDNNTYINDGHVIALSTDRAVILPEVLNTYLSLNDTQAEIYRQYVTGSTNQVDIVFSDIKKMKVPVPSMDEQILFVEVLTQADKSEFELRKSIEAIDQVIKSLINN